ncbi:MAG: SpoIID/LytB domain-containing protein [Myxococcaceae bacterium]|nr:SpoIID/LytB domain-containing protein [Myxococcaceae bacterium]
MERATQVTFSSKGRLRVVVAGPKESKAESAPAAEWTVKLLQSTPATVLADIQLAEVPYRDLDERDALLESLEGQGLKARALTIGELYGVRGKVIDTRRHAILLDEPARTPEAAEARQAELLQKKATRTTLRTTLVTPGAIEVEVRLGDKVVGTGHGVRVSSLDEAPIDVRQVEFGVGYDFHGFEDRSFRGALELAADQRGQLAVVNTVSLEDLLKGLVPSEIFAKAHPEALKAQAVTARGEVLAKVGLKHQADPYLLCSEQHCAVYKGVSGEAATTSAAVDATRGEALFDATGRLVDSVYSAVCGGHTEDNDVVWGGSPSSSLRGKPDTLPGAKAPPPPGTNLAGFLASETAFACQKSSFANPAKFRWEKRFTAKDVEEKTASLGLGAIQAMTVAERGVSGRVKVLTLSGDQGATQVRGELVIRRLFGMLNSAMFEVRPERDAKGVPTAWVFKGGGWGHGVGMCQVGAIGRAEAGQTYREILGHYYSGAQVARLYEER